MLGYGIVLTKGVWKRWAAMAQKIQGLKCAEEQFGPKLSLTSHARVAPALWQKSYVSYGPNCQPKGCGSVRRKVRIESGHRAPT